MILHKKKIYCKDIRNELESYHNKTGWLKFVLMQDSSLHLKSDSVSWQKTQKNSDNSQIQWPVVSTPCQETKVHLNQKVGFEGTPRLDPHCKLQPVAYKVNMDWKKSVNKDNSHSWVRISHGLNKLVTNLNNNEQDDNEQETSEMQFEDYALKSNARAYASRSKAKAKPQRRFLACSSTRTVPVWMGYLLSMVIKVLRSTNNTVQPNHSGIRGIGARPNSKTKTQNDKRRHMVEQLSAVDYVPTDTHSSQGKFSCTFFEDNEAVVKMLVKGRSPTMRHVSRTHRVALGCLTELIWTPKIQIKYVNTKHPLADMLTKGNFTRDEWNSLLCLFNISHFSSTDCTEVMSKRTEKDSGEERVTAKSKPIMNLVSRCSERTLDVLASTASESPGTTRYERQLPLSPQTEPANWAAL